MVPQGIDSYVLFAPQSLQTTLATDGDKARKIAIVSHSVKGDQPFVENPSIGGDSNSRDAALGKIAADGTISLLITPKNAPLIFAKAIQGSIVTTGASDPRTHTAKTVAGQVTPYTIETYEPLDTVQYHRVKTGMVNTASFGVNADGFLQVDLGIMALDTNYATSSTFASGTPLDWTTDIPYDHVGHLAAADVKLNGSAIATVTSWRCNINNNLSRHYVTGGAGAGRWIVRKRQTVEWDLELLFEDLTVRTLATAGTYVAVDLKWAQSVSRSFEVITPRTRLQRSDATPENDDALMLKIKARASKDSTEGTQLKTISLNDQISGSYDA